jgi:hypothetical protein
MECAKEGKGGRVQQNTQSCEALRRAKSQTSKNERTTGLSVKSTVSGTFELDFDIFGRAEVMASISSACAHNARVQAYSWEPRDKRQVARTLRPFCGVPNDFAISRSSLTVFSSSCSGENWVDIVWQGCFPAQFTQGVIQVLNFHKNRFAVIS